MPTKEELEQAWEYAKAFCEADIEYPKKMEAELKAARGKFDRNARWESRRARSEALAPTVKKRRENLLALKKLTCGWVPKDRNGKPLKGDE